MIEIFFPAHSGLELAHFTNALHTNQVTHLVTMMKFCCIGDTLHFKKTFRLWPQYQQSRANVAGKIYCKRRTPPAQGRLIIMRETDPDSDITQFGTDWAEKRTSKTLTPAGFRQRGVVLYMNRTSEQSKVSPNLSPGPKSNPPQPPW